MRKLKQFKIDDTTFKVTLVDNNTNFYNNDTESFLTFETDFEHDQSLLYLTNIDDGSVVTELAMTKTNDGIEYELPHKIIEHYGRWKGQIVFEKGDEKFSTTIFDFEIDRFLVTEKPPTLVEIESLEKMRNDAKELMAELVTGWQALESSVAEVVERGNTAIDEINNSNQAAQEAEADRETEENIRKANETARANAEEDRQSGYTAMQGQLDSKLSDISTDWITPTLLNGATGEVRYRINAVNQLELAGAINIPTDWTSSNQVFTFVDSSYLPLRITHSDTGALYADKRMKFRVSIDGNGSTMGSISRHSNAFYVGNDAPGKRLHVNLVIPLF